MMILVHFTSNNIIIWIVFGLDPKLFLLTFINLFYDRCISFDLAFVFINFLILSPFKIKFGKFII